MGDDGVYEAEHRYDDDGVIEYERLCASGQLDNYDSDEGSESDDILSDSKEDLVRDGDQEIKEPLSFDEVIEMCARRWSI